MGLTLALLAVPARARGAVARRCSASSAAWLVGWCTLVGGRTWTAVFIGTVPAVAAARPGVDVGGASVPELVPRRVVARRNWAGSPPSSAITVALVAVFGGLFAAADPAFAHVDRQPRARRSTSATWSRASLVFGLVLAFVLGGGYLVRFAPRLDAMAPAPMRPVPRWEWALPLGVLDALFIAFVAVQATVLFGGHDHVLETEGLTYAEYARQGFWQLLWVSALTLLVISVRHPGGRARQRAPTVGCCGFCVGTTCATSVVVVISAIHRMWLYQQAYGFSVQRIMVITIELWLGAVFVLDRGGGHPDDRRGGCRVRSWWPAW